MFSRFVFLLVLGFSCLFLCKGAVFPPPNGTSVIFIPGTTEKFVWSFDDYIYSFSNRLWVFVPSDGRRRVSLAEIRGDGDVQILTTSYDVAVEKPATLVLKNVGLTYDGTYQFSLYPGGTSEVVVSIAVKPHATVCSSSITVNEGGNVYCVCQGQGGKPPAEVTWYKDNRKIGETGKEERTLILTNVTHEKDDGNYTCVAQSYPNKMFQDEVEVKVIVTVLDLDEASSNDTSCGTEWYVIVVTLVVGIIMGILFSYIVSCCRRKFGSRKPHSCPEPRACEVDSTYQELDVTKLNTEDNYQSLTVDVAINNVAHDDDSNYTALSKTRDVENNYQSLR